MILFTGPLRRRDLRLLVTGSTVSLVGDGIYSVAMAVAVLHVAGAASALAAMAVINLVPRVVFGLWGGVLADRVSRRGLLAVCDLVRLGVVAALGLLLVSGTPPLWALLLLVAPLGAASGAAAPAFSAILPDLVEPDELVAANGVLSSVSPLAAMVVGPVLGGVLAAYDVGLALFVDAASFGVSALCVLLLRPMVGHDRGPRPLPWAHFREGLRYVRRTPWLATNLLAGLVITFTVSGTMTMLPFLVSRGYHAPAASFGYLLAVGGVAATLCAIVVSSRRPPRRPLAASYTTYALGLGSIAGLGLAPNLVVAAVCMAVFFVGATVGNVFQDSVLGSRVPRELRGRVSSLDWVAATAASPLSVVVAALAADHVGIRPTYVVAGLAAALASLAGLALLLRTGEPGVEAEASADVSTAEVASAAAETEVSQPA
jgi:MFS family permease